MFLQNYRNFASINKYFTFGTLKTQLSASFVWLDSFNKQSKKSPMPTIEMYSSLYNYAVASARQACFMDLSGEGIKNASKFFS